MRHKVRKDLFSSHFAADDNNVDYFRDIVQNCGMRNQ